MDCSTPGFPVLHYFPEFAHAHIHWVNDDIQPSHPLLPPSLALNLSQHQGLFQWVGSSHSGGQSFGASTSASVLPMNIQGWFPLGLTNLIVLLPRDSQESSLVSQFKSINSSVLSVVYGPTLTSIHAYWENHSFDSPDLCQPSDVFAFQYAV